MMPTDKRRINLTIPDAVYERLQTYKERNGIYTDAGACLQLIRQRLNAEDEKPLSALELLSQRLRLEETAG